jgi:hypothetical protein
MMAAGLADSVAAKREGRDSAPTGATTLPSAEILNGIWKFPAPQPVQQMRWMEAASGRVLPR